jgi:hypothetical protein
MFNEKTTWICRLLLPLFCLACQAPPYDYSDYIEHPPKSILVLPPLNETLEVDASYGSLATITRPLAERGFYVFPVALVDAVMRSNGLPTPGEMHQVPPQKLVEIFNPDAILYLTVKDWGASYQVLSSQSKVTLHGTLIDAGSGITLWAGTHSVAKGSGDGGGGVIGMLAAAIVTQVADSISDPSRDICRRTAGELFANPRNGLLVGPYHPEYELGLAAAKARVAKSKAD